MAQPQVQVLVDWNDDGDFTDANDDITADVRELALDHLRDMQTEYMIPALLQMEINNDDHKYSPSNGNSVLTGNLKPGRDIWVRMFYPFDQFVDTNGVQLSAHTPTRDSDWAWVEDIQNFDIQSNVAQTDSTQSNGDCVATMEFNDPDVSLRVFFTRGTDTTDHGGLCIRYVDSSNYAYIRVTGSIIELRKVIGGSDSQVATGSHTWATSTSKDIYLYLHGTNLRVLVDNVEVLDTTLSDSAINNGSKHGLFCDDFADHTWDNFSGYKSLFWGKIDKIRPRPAAGQQYCYIEAFNDFEEFKKDELSAYSNGLSGGPGVKSDAHLGHILNTMDYSSTRRQFDDGTRITYDAREGASTLELPMLDALYRIQDEEDGFAYMDGEGFLRWEAVAHRGSSPHTDVKAVLREVTDVAALDFDGASGDVEVSDDAAIRNIFDGGGTIEARIKPDSDGEASLGHIIHKGTWELQLQDESNGKMRARFLHAWSGDNYGLSINDLTIKVGVETAIAVHYNSDSTGNSASIYQDGVLQTGGSESTPTGTRSSDNIQSLFFGNQIADSRTFDGLIRDVRLWSDVRTAAEILANKDNVLDGDEAGLVGYWRFKEGSGSTLDDETSNDNDGTITGATWVRTVANPSFAQMGWEDGKDGVENRMLVEFQRSVISSTVDVWNLDEADYTIQDSTVQFDASETKEFIARSSSYDVISGRVVPIATTDYLANTAADNTGTNITADLTVTHEEIFRYEGRSVKIKVVWGSTAGYLTLLKQRAVGHTYQNPMVIDDSDSTSITAYGERRKRIQALWLDREDTARTLAANRLARRKDPKTIIDATLVAANKLTLHHMIQRRLSDRIRVVYPDMGINEDFYLEGESWQFSEGGTKVSQTMQLRGV